MRLSRKSEILAAYKERQLPDISKQFKLVESIEREERTMQKYADSL
jgi:hypothetical protein